MVREYDYADNPSPDYQVNQNTPNQNPLIGLATYFSVSAWDRPLSANTSSNSIHVYQPLHSAFGVGPAGPDLNACYYGNCGPPINCFQHPTIGTPAVPGYIYQWSPATYLSNPNIAQPTVNPPFTNKTFQITYTLTITTAPSNRFSTPCCTRTDTVTVTFEYGCTDPSGGKQAKSCSESRSDPEVAQGLPEPIPFSADMRIGAGGVEEKALNLAHFMEGRLYVGNKGLRTEMSVEPYGPAVLITDFGDQRTQVLIPKQQVYLELKISSLDGAGLGLLRRLQPLSDPSNPCSGQEGSTCKNIGVEEVNGRASDHWEITESTGTAYSLWVDEMLRFPIKISQGSTLELTNIQEGEPDASLFQVPASYRKTDWNGIMQGGLSPQQ